MNTISHSIRFFFHMTMYNSHRVYCNKKAMLSHGITAGCRALVQTACS